ncbi:MAG: hypothetical protein HC769_31670 [Cyanobacteria bacterium CRU_2_1]|nr:hypothetical protein [Cyanobacteria bacterium RU_5_0]NJR62946.1 hypothetical protein [Cyanobacteria bacterium CRU_2_1]
MKRFGLVCLSAFTLMVAASYPALALTSSVDQVREGTMNKLNDRFDQERQRTINKLSDRFDSNQQNILNK